MNLSRISPKDLDKPSKKLIFTAWTRSYRTSEEVSGQLPLSFNLYPWIHPLATMEELYRRADKYSTLEDNIRVASQTVMITAQNSKASTKGQPEQKGSQNKNQKRSQEQSEKKGSLPNSPLLTSLMTGSYLSSRITPILNGPHQ